MKGSVPLNVKTLQIPSFQRNCAGLRLLKCFKVWTFLSEIENDKSSLKNIDKQFVESDAPRWFQFSEDNNLWDFYRVPSNQLVFKNVQESLLAQQWLWLNLSLVWDLPLMHVTSKNLIYLYIWIVFITVFVFWNSFVTKQKHFLFVVFVSSNFDFWIYCFSKNFLMVQ